MVLKKGNAGATFSSSSLYELSNQSSRNLFPSTRPSWLLVSIADLDKRMKMVCSSSIKEHKADSFAEQAEAYYQKRPQLLSLLQDLYNGYLTLADRYCRALAKQHSSPIMTPVSIHQNSDDEVCSNEVSDAESSISFQAPVKPLVVMNDADGVVAELVVKNVEYEIVVDEMNEEEKKWSESSRKMELQKSLLEVLETERLVLLNENARLEYKVETLVDENKALGEESFFMKTKASELARCVLKLREDYKVNMSSSKIEDLQAQIYALEKRNKEYHDQLVKQNGDRNTIMKAKRNTIVLMKRCSQSPKKVCKLWKKVTNFDMLKCCSNYNP
ncbi:kinase-interacting family protein-like [Apium graveolens]|uniref:kinase-interacting family protein-like n=1 Tax=Apium graveolens TaxID=4045 RepID=UPI003D7A2D8C